MSKSTPCVRGKNGGPASSAAAPATAPALEAPPAGHPAVHDLRIAAGPMQPGALAPGRPDRWGAACRRCGAMARGCSEWRALLCSACAQPPEFEHAAHKLARSPAGFRCVRCGLFHAAGRRAAGTCARCPVPRAPSFLRPWLSHTVVTAESPTRAMCVVCGARRRTPQLLAATPCRRDAVLPCGAVAALLARAYDASLEAAAAATRAHARALGWRPLRTTG